MVVRDRIELSTFRFSGGRSYRLSYLTLAIQLKGSNRAAVLTGFEPATSTLTGWRALRLLYRTLLSEALVPRSQEHITDAGVVAASVESPREEEEPRAPNGIRTRAAALKGRCPRPLDDGGSDGVPP